MADTLETNELIAAQVGAEESFRTNGTEDRLYNQPDDNCCYIYIDHQKNGKHFTRRERFPLCWTKEKRGSETEIDFAKDEYGSKRFSIVKGVDCGKDTWVTLHEVDDDWAGVEVGSYIGLAGRIAFEDNYPYDDAKIK